MLWLKIQKSSVIIIKSNSMQSESKTKYKTSFKLVQFMHRVRQKSIPLNILDVFSAMAEHFIMKFHAPFETENNHQTETSQSIWDNLPQEPTDNAVKEFRKRLKYRVASRVDTLNIPSAGGIVNMKLQHFLMSFE